MPRLAMRGDTSLSGSLGLRVINAETEKVATLREVKRWKRKQFFQYGWREIPLRIFLFFYPLLVFLIPGLNVQVGRLYGKVIRNKPDVPDDWVFLSVFANGTGVQILRYEDECGDFHDIPLNGHLCREAGTRVFDYGLIGVHLVVTAGKNYLAACMDNTSEPENLKFHAYGTGVTAAAAGDTALQTELTTQYATDNTRPTGSQAHSTNTYTTVATVTPDAAVALTEWGLLTQAATGGGTLLDRQVFSAVNLNGTGDSLQTTYVFTFN